MGYYNETREGPKVGEALASAGKVPASGGFGFRVVGF